MQSRLELHAELCDVLGSRNVYYQPPPSLKLKYPAIVYHLEGIENIFSGNRVYMQNCTYRVIMISGEPDSNIVGKISILPKSRYINHYTSDNLYHDVFRIIRQEKVID